LVGIGTSWHAALVGEYYFSQLGHQNVRAYNSMEFVTYPPEMSNIDIIIVLSHRGWKKYSKKALEMAKKQELITVAITGLNSAVPTEICDYIFTTSEQERCSAFTLSHTGAMGVLLLIASELGTRKLTKPLVLTNSSIIKTSIPQLSLITETIISQCDSKAKEWAKFAIQNQIKNYFFVSYGVNVSTCLEVSLKLKEACYVITEGFQLEQYIHGPFVATDKHTLVTFLIPPIHTSRSDDISLQVVNKDLIERFTSTAKYAKHVGAKIAVIQEQNTNDSVETGIIDINIELPKMNDTFTPIAYLLPLQLFTYWLSLELKVNPDNMRNDEEIYADRAKFLNL